MARHPGSGNGQGGTAAARAQLSDRFQEAIDAAAMSAGLFDSDGYLEEWRRRTRACGDDLEAEVTDEAARIEQAYGDDELATLARAGGIAGEETT